MCYSTTFVWHFLTPFLEEARTVCGKFFSEGFLFFVGEGGSSGNIFEPNDTETLQTAERLEGLHSHALLCAHLTWHQNSYSSCYENINGWSEMQFLIFLTSYHFLIYPKL